MKEEQMQKQNFVDRMAYALRDGELSIDTAVACAAGALLKDPYLREATVKRVIAAILTGKWQCEEPSLDKLVSGHNETMAWLAERKEAAKRIDPDNVEVECWRVFVTDPYCVRPHPITDLTHNQCFARTPGGDDGWVWFEDLPEATQEEMGRKLNACEGEDDGRVWRSRKKSEICPKKD